MASAQLFEVEPDLLSCVPACDRHIALRAGLLTVERIPSGRWDPVAWGAAPWGLLITDGMLAREVVVAGTAAAELLGAGDVVVPRGQPENELVPSEATWTVLETLRVAVLDERFSTIVRRWPQVSAGLLARAERRADRLAVTQAISHLTRVDTRVLTMLWLLAGRWGRVTATGIVLPLRLTHRTLARLVGARRPSVTTALSDLGRRGLVSRRDDGSWALHGAPPDELERVGLSARISWVPAPAPHGPATEHDELVLLSSIQRMAGQIRELATVYEEHQRRAEAAAAVQPGRGRAQPARPRDAAPRIRDQRTMGSGPSGRTA